jgi:hypothetical protein
MCYPASSCYFDSGRLRAVRLRFHVTFSASKCYHSNDISVTESVNTTVDSETAVRMHDIFLTVVPARQLPLMLH